MSDQPSAALDNHRQSASIQSLFLAPLTPPLRLLLSFTLIVSISSANAAMLTANISVGTADGSSVQAGTAVTPTYRDYDSPTLTQTWSFGSASADLTRGRLEMDTVDWGAAVQLVDTLSFTAGSFTTTIPAQLILEISGPGFLTHAEVGTITSAGGALTQPVGNTVTHNFGINPSEPQVLLYAWILGSGKLSAQLSLVFGAPDVSFVSESGAFLTALNPVPVPAAAWLFASALGVFGYLGKRKANA